MAETNLSITTPAPSSGAERLAAFVSHGSPFLGLPFLLPLLVWLLYPMLFEASPYVRQQSFQALLFHLLIAIGGGILAGLGGAFWYIILIGWPFAIACWIAGGVVLIWGVVVEVIACIKALQGEPYQLPVVGR